MRLPVALRALEGEDPRTAGGPKQFRLSHTAIGLFSSLWMRPPSWPPNSSLNPTFLSPTLASFTIFNLCRAAVSGYLFQKESTTSYFQPEPNPPFFVGLSSNSVKWSRATRYKEPTQWHANILYFLAASSEHVSTLLDLSCLDYATLSCIREQTNQDIRKQVWES